jgi:hypothetical protein
MIRRTMAGCALAAFLGIGCGDSPPEDPRQLPPITSTDDINNWLTAGYYKTWRCEQTIRPALGPPGVSPHGMSRTCSNNLLSTNPDGEYPVGAASVKELADNNGNLKGYSISRHFSVGSRPAAWFWFERNIQGVVVAAGTGERTPQDVCSNCHAKAGDVASTGIEGGHDYVFLQVRPAP